MNLPEKIISEIKDALKAARMDTASFGFTDDRIEVVRVHFGDDTTGRKGDVIHPTDYVKRITRLHHQTWIIKPLESALSLLEANTELLAELDQLRDILKSADLERLLDNLRAGEE